MRREGLCRRRGRGGVRLCRRCSRGTRIFKLRYFYTVFCGSGLALLSTHSYGGSEGTKGRIIRFDSWRSFFCLKFQGRHWNRMAGEPSWFLSRCCWEAGNFLSFWGAGKVGVIDWLDNMLSMMGLVNGQRQDSSPLYASISSLTNLDMNHDFSSSR